MGVHRSIRKETKNRGLTVAHCNCKHHASIRTDGKTRMHSRVNEWKGWIIREGERNSQIIQGNGTENRKIEAAGGVRGGGGKRDAAPIRLSWKAPC
jgi:hypothetical protein